MNKIEMQSQLLKRKAQLLFLACGASVIMSGCVKGEPTSLLEGTLLEGACIGTVDNNYTTILQASRKDASSDSSHYHYKDVLTGEVLTDYANCISSNIRICESINVTGSVLEYLTEEELKAATVGELTNGDYVNIFMRINLEDKTLNDAENTKTLK